MKHCYLFLFLLLLCACGGTKTEKFANKLNEKCPIDMIGGKLQNVECKNESHCMDINIRTDNKDYNFDVMNENPETAKNIRTLQLSAYGERNNIGHLLRLAAEDGYTIDIVFRGLQKEDQNVVRFTPAELSKIFDEYGNQSAQLISIKISLEYINVGLPQTVDDVTTEDKAFFDDGTLVIHHIIKEKDLDWEAIEANKGNIRSEIAGHMKIDCKKDKHMETLFRQCIAGSYNYAYEYEGDTNKNHKLRITFSANELKKMLTN